VRELENILERALAMVPDQTIEAEDLQFEPAFLLNAAGSSAVVLGQADAALPLCLPAHLRTVERALLKRALRQARFQRAQAAQLLGISLRQLRYRMQRLAIHEYD
jgi:two-component system response regulator PilR (NtrC family)